MPVFKVTLRRLVDEKATMYVDAETWEKAEQIAKKYDGFMDFQPYFVGDVSVTKVEYHEESK